LGSVTQDLAIKKARTEAYNGPSIVSFVGEIGSGKSTAAKYLVEHWGFTYLRFAGPLKDMLYALGLSKDQVDGNLKEVPCDALLGKTPRWAMQSLGTEWGRDCIGNGFWMGLWKQRAKKIVDSGRCVVVDDCRFENEHYAIQDLGGVQIRILRDPLVGAERSPHVSEAFRVPSDLQIPNIDTVDFLYENIDQVLGIFGAR